MGFLHLGILSVVFSDTLISGLETAAAIHVVTSQLPMLFDVKPARIKTRYFKLVYVSLKIFNNPFIIFFSSV
jgi:MFS superfamily sulfate permease-like transporter